MNRSDRDELQKYITEDRAKMLAERAETMRRLKEDYHNPRAFYFGIAVVTILLGLGWLLRVEMRCDPMYSDIGLQRSKECKDPG